MRSWPSTFLNQEMFNIHTHASQLNTASSGGQKKLAFPIRDSICLQNHRDVQSWPKTGGKLVYNFLRGGWTKESHGLSRKK